MRSRRPAKRWIFLHSISSSASVLAPNFHHVSSLAIYRFSAPGSVSRELVSFLRPSVPSSARRPFFLPIFSPSRFLTNLPAGDSIFRPVFTRMYFREEWLLCAKQTLKGRARRLGVVKYRVHRHDGDRHSEPFMTIKQR